MVISIASRFLRWVGRRMPFLLAILSVIIALLPLRMPGDLELTPLYPLMVVFFWGIHRGDLMTPAPIFFTGLAYDLLSGAPVGLWALTFLVCHAMALVLRDTFGRVLRTAWALFAIICMTACLLAWTIWSIYDWQLQEPVKFAVQGLVSIGLYPFFGFAFAFIERRVIAPMRA